jgi:hypothetical protein
MVKINFNKKKLKFPFSHFFPPCNFLLPRSPLFSSILFSKHLLFLKFRSISSLPLKKIEGFEIENIIKITS